MRINIYGCGAVGSYAAFYVAQFIPEAKLNLYDDDRIGKENIGTSLYNQGQVYAFKARALAQMLWYYGCEATPTVGRVNCMYNCDDYALDCFDNARSRKLIRGDNVLHVGVSRTPSGHVTWDSEWKPPKDVDGPNPICTHQLGAFILAQTGLTAALILARDIEGDRRDAYIAGDGQVQII